MNMNIASLLLAAGVFADTASGQLSLSYQKQRLRASSEKAYAADEEGSTFQAKRNGKSGKGGKTSKGDKPGCVQDEFLEARFGPQLCQSEIDMKFEKTEDMYITSRGLMNFRSPNYSVPLVDTFQTDGRIDMTYEQAQSVCVTMCGNDPNCETVYISPAAARYPGSKTRYFCRMFNPALGPGAYQVPETEGFNAPEPNSVVYTKVTSAPLPPFEPCNISYSDIETGIGCLFGQINNPEICDPILTDDWMQYISPAAICLVSPPGSETVLNDCLTCLTTEEFSSVEEFCLTDPQYSFIRGTCGDVCYTNDVQQCEESLQTALLCVTGALPTRLDVNLYSGGWVNGPDYVCPAE